MVRRSMWRKKAGFDVEAQGIYTDLKKNLLIRGLENVRIFYRYDVEGLSDEQYRQAGDILFFRNRRLITVMNNCRS